MSDFGPIVDQVRISNQRNNRSGGIVRMIWHHQASTNDDATIQMMVTGSRQVSATYTVNNDNPGSRGWSRITGVVPERFRPWTTASWGDDAALTVECANSSGDPTWGIADASVEACARIAAYAFTAYGVPLRRASRADNTGHLGHNEAPSIFGDSYSTFCAGHLDINRIITRATQILDGEDEMSAEDSQRLQRVEAAVNRLLNPFQAGVQRDAGMPVDPNEVPVPQFLNEVRNIALSLQNPIQFGLTGQSADPNNVNVPAALTDIINRLDQIEAALAPS